LDREYPQKEFDLLQVAAALPAAAALWHSAEGAAVSTAGKAWEIVDQVVTSGEGRSTILHQPNEGLEPVDELPGDFALVENPKWVTHRLCEASRL
jgi:hypothetical protein